MKHFQLTVLALAFFFGANAQDTFSIVAIDSVSGEVGSAGASCVELSSFPGFDDDFLGELFPGVGAINSQAWYDATNQANARNRMNAGDTPSQIVQWLIANDVANNPGSRQYGIVAVVNGSPQSAAHTGSSTDDYKGHRLGPNYAIQGNILLGPQILDSMEARFLNEPGDLSCKLMAAMQGANVIGADSRCDQNGSSSLFAFLKVAQASDLFGSPSLLISIRTEDGDNIEPIDSLQILLNQVHSCPNATSIVDGLRPIGFTLFPNPASGRVHISLAGKNSGLVQLFSATGELLRSLRIAQSGEIDISDLTAGIYSVLIKTGQQRSVKRLIVE